MSTLDAENPLGPLPTLAVALVALVVVGDLLLIAVPAFDALRFLLVGVAVLVGGVLVAAGVRRSPAAGGVALLVLPVIAVYAYTGLLLPWTELSFTVGQLLVELSLSLPVVGEPLAQLLFGGFTLSQATLRHAFTLHYAVVALAGLALCSVLALALVGEPSRGDRADTIEK